MTFLEFVIEKHIGQPTYRGNGYSKWHCPFHNDHSPSFATRPPKKTHPIKFKCWGCGAWGDASDFLALHKKMHGWAHDMQDLWNEYDKTTKQLILRGRGDTSSPPMWWGNDSFLRRLLKAETLDEILELHADMRVEVCRAMERERIAMQNERRSKS